MNACDGCVCVMQKREKDEAKSKGRGGGRQGKEGHKTLKVKQKGTRPPGIIIKRGVSV